MADIVTDMPVVWPLSGSHVGGVGGTLGTLSHSAGNLTWGTTGAPPDKIITLQGVGGNMTAGRLAFVGAEANKFQITSRAGDALPTPHNCGTSGDFHFAFNNDTTFTITFQTLFADESEQTMSVEVYSATGTLVATIAASATYVDAVLAAATANGAFAFWSARDLTLGALGNNVSALTDIFGPETAVKTDTTTYGNAAGWTVVATSSTVPSVSKALKVVGAATPPYNQPAAVTANLSQNVAGALLIYKLTTLDYPNTPELLRLNGTRGSYPDAGIDAPYIQATASPAPTYPVVVRISDGRGLSNPPAGYTAQPTPTVWLTVAILTTDAGATNKTRASLVGGAFGGIGTDDFVTGNTTDPTETNGLVLTRFFGQAEAQFAGVVVFPAGTTMAQIQAVHESIPSGM